MTTRRIVTLAAVIVMLSAVTPAPGLLAASVEIAIDTSKTGPPISPYLYGQFIEHVGSTINQGIWAEMIRDRKFLIPVGHRRSPWKSTAADKTEMVFENPLAGAQSVLVAPGGGIVQQGLKLVEGKTYNGYVRACAAGKPGRLTVRVRWGNAQKQQATFDLGPVQRDHAHAPGYARLEFAFPAGATTDDAVIEIAAAGQPVVLGAVSLMPADNVDGFHAGIIAAMKRFRGAIYRYPGGNFVSGYRWMDGIGPRDRRPPRWERAWGRVEPNDVGVDEFIRLCKLLEAEPLICVNSGLGTAAEAAAQVQYVNGSPDTAMGQMRAQNGHKQPYDVRWWGIGNEMYGGWQMGRVPLEQYVKRHNCFAEAMRKIDPHIKLVGVGAVGGWSHGMLESCADAMDLISEHVYARVHNDPASHVASIVKGIRAKAAAHRAYRKQLASLKGKDIRITLDEWNYSLFGRRPWPYGIHGIDMQLQDGLGIAAGLNELTRNTDIYAMAHYSITVNVFGAINRVGDDVAIATDGLALILHRNRYGKVPVAVKNVPEGTDVAAALSEDRKTLAVSVVNPTAQTRQFSIKLKGAALEGTGHVYWFGGHDPKAMNQPRKQQKVRLDDQKLDDAGVLKAVPYSASIFRLALKY